ncbi:MAG: thioredoxin fold domain-containing protein [Micavibrio aeruginosavorus]|uniref:Thioredoxin fold domain-containing protein n=1 Tax=Micavibrio aeruginosavorus TaxID=349221 RepID=A0A7T5R2R4_9BACT|nr:MAG: thioredoxin fold domain-containing protein [Micavibrio aeruginosavorus]
MTSFARLCLSLLFFVIMSNQSMAQTVAGKEPPLPAPLETMAKEGAQLRYMGQAAGLDSWIAIQNGQEQYFYVTPDREYVLLGLLFDKTGKMITLQQVSALQKQGDSVLDILQAEAKPETESVTKNLAGEKEIANKILKSPAEQLFTDVESANWVRLGQEAAPAIYMFIDPQCPYCHEFMKTLRPDIEGGKIQIRMIPVGFKDDTRAQAALLLAIPSPQERWFRHLDGDAEALPVTPGINEQGVERNMSIMQSWKLNVTPLSLYRAKDGTVKIVQGRAKDVKALMSDLHPVN